MLMKEKLKFMSTIEIYELVLNREISRFPEFFWDGEEGKARGLECLNYLLFSKLKWSDEDVLEKFSKKILKDYRLYGMLAQCFDNSPMRCILTLMGDKYQPWEYKVAPTNYWTRETAKSATLFMLNKLQWDDEDIKSKLSVSTFKDFGLLSMLSTIYNASPYKALNDVCPHIKEWELQNVPLNFWNEKNCKEATLWVINTKLNGKYHNMSFEEIRDVFVNNGLGYILHSKFNNSIKKIFKFVDIDLIDNIAVA